MLMPENVSFDNASEFILWILNSFKSCVSLKYVVRLPLVLIIKDQGHEKFTVMLCGSSHTYASTLWPSLTIIALL